MAEPPQLLPISFGDEVFEESDAATASCVVKKGDMPLEIIWKLDSEALTTSSDVNIMNIGKRTSILTITSLKAKHQGIYTCLAVNAVGSSEESAKLIVHGILLCRSSVIPCSFLCRMRLLFFFCIITTFPIITFNFHVQCHLKLRHSHFLNPLPWREHSLKQIVLFCVETFR